MSVLLAGCLHDPPPGPLYVPAASPEPGFARVYLYRVDHHHSFSTVEIRIDGEEPFHIHDGEYATLTVADGVHAMDFRLLRRLVLPSIYWSEQRIRAHEGEKIYFEVSVRVVERWRPSSNESHIAGREIGTSAEIVSIELRNEEEAIEAMRSTHLRSR